MSEPERNPKKNLGVLFDEMEGVAPEASEADPGLGTRLDPPEPPEGEAAVAAAPLHARPRHPEWLGKPITESAIRQVQLWPRTGPAPAAVGAASKRWGAMKQRSGKAWNAATSKPEAAAMDILYWELGLAYRHLGCGGAPPRELARDESYPDLSPNDPDRVQFDTAVLVIAKAQVAINDAYAKGGAWRAAVENV